MVISPRSAIQPPSARMPIWPIVGIAPSVGL